MPPRPEPGEAAPLRPVPSERTLSGSFGTFDGEATETERAFEREVADGEPREGETLEVEMARALPRAPRAGSTAAAADRTSPQSLLEHGRSIVVSQKVFHKPARPSREQLAAAQSVTCGPSGVSIPLLTTPIHPAALPVRIWTAFMLALTLTYVAFLEPIFIAFNTTLTNSRTTAVTDFVSGAAFTLDVLFNFRIGFFYLCEGHVKLVLDQGTIAREYLSRYFVVDFLAAVPFLAQLVYYAFILITGAPPGTHYLIIYLMRIFRLLRVVRLWKLFMSRRALLGAEIFVVHQTGTPLLVFGATVVYWFAFLVNLMACVFIFVATSEGFCDSWVAQLAQPEALTADLSPLTPVNACGAATGEALLLPSQPQVFLSALYFSTMTITTVGYGDVVAKTGLEKAVVIFFMLVSAFFIATFTGQMVAVLAKHGSASAAETAFKDRMVEADRFVKDNELPPRTAAQVMAWVQRAYMPHEARFSWKSDLLAELPVDVRASAVSAMVGGAALRAALRGAAPETLHWVAGLMQPRSLHVAHYLCLAGDTAGELYFTAAGCLALVGANGKPVGSIPGRGFLLGGPAAAAALQRAESDTAEGEETVWPCSVTAVVESSFFALPHAALRTAVRLGAAAAGRSYAAEAAAVAAGLRDADALAVTLRK